MSQQVVILNRPEIRHPELDSGSTKIPDKAKAFTGMTEESRDSRSCPGMTEESRDSGSCPRMTEGSRDSRSCPGMAMRSEWRVRIEVLILR
jgi:hypothetical protein